MKSIHEQLLANFVQWTRRGQGVLFHDDPVSPRPPFVRFPGHRLGHLTSGDDGARAAKAGSVFNKIVSWVRGDSHPPSSTDEEPTPLMEDATPHWGHHGGDWVEVRTRFPSLFAASPEAMASLLANLSLLESPIAFEIIGTHGKSWMQWATESQEAAALHDQLSSHFPEAELDIRHDSLKTAWNQDREGLTAIVDFGLAGPFMLPLALPKSDLLVGLIGSLVSLEEDETALCQVLFTPAPDPWSEEALAAVSGQDERPLPMLGASFHAAAKNKMKGPLYGAVLRLAAKSASLHKSWQILRGMAPALSSLAMPEGNELVPLVCETDDDEQCVNDLLSRQSRRSGMLLNQHEMMALVHPPSPSVQARTFLRADSSTRRAPDFGSRQNAVCLGTNEHNDERREVWLSQEHRLRHTHVIGATGMGKSTLLLQMIQQDIANGAGLAVLDPHGDLIGQVMALVPDHRASEVVLLDPSDENFSVGFNLLDASSEHEKALLASDLVAVWRRLSTSWGDQMNSVLGNAVRAFLEHDKGGTLAELRRFLLEPAYREAFLEQVRDPELVYYWRRTYPQLGGNKSLGPILTRLDNFLAPRTIRRMVCQSRNLLDLPALMDRGGILLAKLSQGLIGAENSHLLGSLLVMKFQMAALSRQRLPGAGRRPFWLYMDEFQNFITPSMAEMLSGARKYGLGLVLAHQQLQHLQRNEDVSASVLANTCTRIVFRTSDEDARHLEKGLSHFTAKHIQSLGVGEAIVRIERGDQDFNLKTLPPTGIKESEAVTRRDVIVEASRRQFARPSQEIDAEIYKALEESMKAYKAKPAPRSEVAPPSPIAAEPEKVTAPPVAVPEPVVEPVVGKGRGGADHQLIVEQLRAKGTELGYSSAKEASVPGGRIDLTLENRDRRIAIEVAVNSYTSHEIDNLSKCLTAGFDFVVSVSPFANVIQNIQKSAAQTFDSESQKKLLLLSPEEALNWLSSLPVTPPEPGPPAERTKLIAGRRVKVKHLEVSPEERRTLEAEQLEIIADLVSGRRSREVDK